MKAVDQKIVDKDIGDCTRACLASILELNSEDVPNFIEYQNYWFQCFHGFLTERKLYYYGTGWIKSDDRPCGIELKDSPNIDGFVIASVPSRTFSDIGHSVVMDLTGMIVHDPNPNKLWQGVNAVENNGLQHWMMIGKFEEKYSSL